MRRRQAREDPSAVHGRLRRFELDEWADDEPGEWLDRKVRAYKRWLAARREHVEQNGLSYVDTFRPQWRHRNT